MCNKLNAATEKWIILLADAKSNTFYMSGTEIAKYKNDNMHLNDNGALAIAEMFVQKAKVQNTPIDHCFK